MSTQPFKPIAFIALFCFTTNCSYAQIDTVAAPGSQKLPLEAIKMSKIQNMELSNYLKKNGNPASEEAFSAFEAKYKIALPASVKAILSYSNGCSPVHRIIDMGENLPEYLIDFFSLDWIDHSIQNMKTVEAEFHYYFSDVLLPIGDAGSGRFLCIGMKAPYENNLYVINYQNYDYQDLNSMLTYIGPSIENLLLRLKPD